MFYGVLRAAGGEGGGCLPAIWCSLGRSFLGKLVTPELDTPGTHAQGHILCDLYKVECCQGNVLLVKLSCHIISISAKSVS